MNLWTLHNLATTYHARPSTLLGVDDDTWLAYQVDLACLTVGRRVERAASGEGVQTVEEVLGITAKAGTTNERRPDLADARKRDPRQFGQLAWRVRRTMRVPESGIW